MNNVYQIVRWEDTSQGVAPQYSVTDLHDVDTGSDNDTGGSARCIGVLVPIDFDAGALSMCVYSDPDADDHPHDKPCAGSIATFREALDAATETDDG